MSLIRCRALAILVAVFWLLAVNHCAFADVFKLTSAASSSEQTQDQASGCSHHSSSSKHNSDEKKQGGDSSCANNACCQPVLASSEVLFKPNLALEATRVIQNAFIVATSFFQPQNFKIFSGAVATSPPFGSLFESLLATLLSAANAPPA